MVLRFACAVLTVLGTVTAASAAEAPRPSPGRKDIVGTEKSLYSHAKEEIIVRDFFQDRRDGVFLDVGCWHPVSDSNTYYLEEHLGWSGIGVDALPELAPKWKRRRPKSKFANFLVTDRSGGEEIFHRADDMSDISSVEKLEKDPGGAPVKLTEIKVPIITLTKLLDDHGIKQIDFLSMDIEGHEPPALAGFDIDRFKPALACVEAKVKNREAILKYFADHGYERLMRYDPYDSNNYYFAPKTR